MQVRYSHALRIAQVASRVPGGNKQHPQQRSTELNCDAEMAKGNIAFCEFSKGDRHMIAQNRYSTYGHSHAGGLTSTT